MPGFVCGRNELVGTREGVNWGTNRLFLGPILWVKNEEGPWTEAYHVEDVARVHVVALDQGVVKGESNLGVVYKGREGGERGVG